MSAVLRTHHEDVVTARKAGQTLLQIARTYGVTRSAVASYCRRYRRDFSDMVEKRPERVHNISRTVKRPAPQPAGSPPRDRTLNAKGEPVDIDLSAHRFVSFCRTGANMCMRPLRGSGMHMLVCGNPTDPGQSYCETCRPALHRPIDADQNGAIKRLALRLAG